MIELTMAMGLAALCICAGIAFLVRRRRGEDTVRHIVRLGVDIVSVAASIESDVARSADPASLSRISARCRECRERAQPALEDATALRQQDAQWLRMTLLQLHEDHLRIVELRSELDRALSAAAKPAPDSRSREVKFSRSRSSCWPSSSFLTRPSTLI